MVMMNSCLFIVVDGDGDGDGNGPLEQNSEKNLGVG